MTKKTTIYDIAKKLDITAASVSRALNDNPKISDKTKALVVEMAAKMNYKRNTLAQALQTGKSNNIGVIVPRIDTTFFGSVIRGIEEVLYAKGYHVIICQTHGIENREVENITTLINAQVDGILMSISSTSIDLDIFDQILNKNIPLVFFDRKKEIAGVSSVTVNDFDGGYKVTKQLIDQKCKRIVHIKGNPKFEIFQERYKGYKQALLDHDLEYHENFVIESKSDVEEGRRVAKRLLKMDPLPDAVFSSSDFTALGIIQELTENGVKIPEEVCVSGFSNEPFTKFMELSITTVDQSPVDMGRMAAKVFLEQIDNKEIKIEKKVVLDPKLMIRKSSLKSTH